MEEIIVSKILKNKLDNLPQILFDQSYFGFMHSAEKYVNRIYDFINTIPSQSKYKTSDSKYGEYYARLEVKNKRTIYYLTYSFEGNFYFIKNIFTRHELGYYKYIKGIH